MRVPATWAGRIVGLLVLLSLALVAVVGVAYAADAKIEADVVAKSCSPFGTNLVTVKTRLFGIRHTAAVDFASCEVVRVGNFVEYRVRSQRTTIYEAEGGRCIWDSSTGPC